MPEKMEVLRIIVGEDHKYGHRPLHEALVEKARERGLAGATAVRGLMGYGKKNRIHTSKILTLSQDLPVVIEVIDEADRIAAFLPDLEDMIQHGIVTLEKIKVVINR